MKMDDRTADWSFDQPAELERAVACGHHCADGILSMAAAFRVGLSLAETRNTIAPCASAIEALKLQRRKHSSRSRSRHNP
jgi:hypothetical protein